MVRAMSKTHPLLAYIERLPGRPPSRKRLRFWNIDAFATTFHFNPRTLYTMVHGETLPLTPTLRRLELVTGGQVSVQACIDWYYQRQPRRKQA